MFVDLNIFAGTFAGTFAGIFAGLFAVIFAGISQAAKSSLKWKRIQGINMFFFLADFPQNDNTYICEGALKFIDY